MRRFFRWRNLRGAGIRFFCRTAAAAFAVAITMPGVAAAAGGEPLVGAYYYPWYGGDFHGGHYLRARLVPAQAPAMGEYDGRTSGVIAQQLSWARRAGVGLWAASWWGPGSETDRTLLQHVLPHPELGGMRIAAFYETAGRTREFSDYSTAEPDLRYLAAHYFRDPHYFRIDGKPVLFVYLTRDLSARGKLTSVVQAMRAGARAEGFEIFVIGDQVFADPPADPGEIPSLDAVTDYDVYGTIGAKGYAGEEGLQRFARKEKAWIDFLRPLKVGFVPSVSPGFNDHGVRDGHAALSRKLTRDAPFGSLFSRMLSDGLNRTDPRAANLLMVTSWNEWHEDSQIEPTNPAPPTTEDDTGEQRLTEGLAYEGYGTRYLDLLSAALVQSKATTAEAGEKSAE